MIGSVKEEYARKEEALATDRAEFENLKQNIETEIEKRANDMFQIRTTLYQTYVTGATLYAMLLTSLAAIQSDTFMSDFKSFFSTIWEIILASVNLLLNSATYVAQISDNISQPIIACILHWLIWLMLMGIFCIGIIGFMIIGCALVSEFIKDYIDKFSLGVALISLALTVFFANTLSAFIPINLLLLNILLAVLLICVRKHYKI